MSMDKELEKLREQFDEKIHSLKVETYNLCHDTNVKSATLIACLQEKLNAQKTRLPKINNERNAKEIESLSHKLDQLSHDVKTFKEGQHGNNVVDDYDSGTGSYITSSVWDDDLTDVTIIDTVYQNDEDDLKELPSRISPRNDQTLKGNPYDRHRTLDRHENTSTASLQNDKNNVKKYTQSQHALNVYVVNSEPVQCSKIPYRRRCDHKSAKRVRSRSTPCISETRTSSPKRNSTVKKEGDSIEIVSPDSVEFKNAVNANDISDQSAEEDDGGSFPAGCTGSSDRKCLSRSMPSVCGNDETSNKGIISSISDIGLNKKMRMFKNLKPFKASLANHDEKSATSMHSDDTATDDDEFKNCKQFSSDVESSDEENWDTASSGSDTDFTGEYLSDLGSGDIRSSNSETSTDNTQEYIDIDLTIQEDDVMTEGHDKKDLKTKSSSQRNNYYKRYMPGVTNPKKKGLALLMLLDANSQFLDAKTLWKSDGIQSVSCQNFSQLTKAIGENNCQLKCLLINVGVNEVDSKRPKEVHRELVTLVRKIKQKHYNVKIVLCEITPRMDKLDQTVLATNKLLRKSFKSETNVFLVSHDNLRNVNFFYDERHFKKEIAPLFAANIKGGLCKAHSVQIDEYNYKCNDTPQYWYDETTTELQKADSNDKDIIDGATNSTVATTTETQTTETETKPNLKRDTNENVKQLSTSSASSELSLDGKTGRVESWSQSLEKLLSDAVGLKCFQEFLKKEFSEENLLFWVACERFKRMTDITQMKNVAHEISRNYLSGNAPFLVNVDSVAVKKTETELNTPHTDMFSIPQQQVFQLMKFDSYNRFLKSTLYQECLLAETSDRLFPYEEEMDGELRKNPLWSKSMKSPISDNEKRKNPLNFLNRGKNAKSPDPDKVRKERSSSLGAYDDCNRKNIVHPAEMNGHTPKDNQLWEGTQSKSRIVRVIMPDGTSGVIVGERGQTLREGLKELCEQKNFPLQSIDVTVGYDKKIANLDTDISSLHENIVYLERRILLRFDLPNGRSVGVKSSPNKTLREVLQPVMKTNGFEMDHYTVLLINTKTSLSLDANITTVENKRLVTKLNHRKLEKQNSDSAVSRIGAQGFRASFRKFRTNSTNFSEGKDDKTDTGRKTTRKKSDDGAAALMTVLQKSQSSRLDDQRGLISRDNEIPDFLKVTSSTPSPVRNKIVNAINNNLFNSTPLKTVHQYPGTPFIVDKNFKDLTEKLDLSLSSPMNLRGRPSLCSVRSWKELPSPDRELVDRSYTFDTSYTVDRTRTSADSINALSPATKNKIGLLELSKSDSSLLTRDSLINVSTRSSTEPNCSPGNSQKYISSKAESGSGGLNTAASDDAFRDRSVSCDNSFKKRNEKKLNKNSIRCNEHVPKGGRPLPINKFNESEILRCLDQDDTVIIATPEKKNSQQQLCDQNNDIRLDSGIDTNPSNSDNNLNNTNTDSESKDRSAKSTPTKFGLTLDTPKAQSTERIGSVDIVDYDLSPRSVERYRKLSLSDDMLMNSINRDVFEGNAVPTPEKGKLLKGETIRGRQNEKITFV